MAKYKYEDIYNWNVLDEIGQGKEAYVLDKKLNEVENVRTMKICDLVKILNSEEKDRYYFYRAVAIDEK